MLVHIWCAPTWRFHTELCKFLRNISTNICGLGKRTDVKLGEVSCLFISNKITISWLYPLNGFRFIFLLRDSENDLYWRLCGCRALPYCRLPLSRTTHIHYHVRSYSLGFPYTWLVLWLPLLGNVKQAKIMLDVLDLYCESDDKITQFNLPQAPALNTVLYTLLYIIHSIIHSIIHCKITQCNLPQAPALYTVIGGRLVEIAARYVCCDFVG